MVDPDAVKDEQRAFYGEGDYSWLARWFMPAAQDLVQAAGVQPGDRVLDVAAGDGNVGSAAAHRGAVVTAIDLTPEQVEAGQARSTAQDHEVKWLVGDAEALPFPDASFDHVLSAFGAMYAPRPAVAVAEMFRVAGPGALVGAVSWPPDGFNARLYAAAAPFLPAADDDDGPDPDDWGDEIAVRRLFSEHAVSVEVDFGVVARRTASAEALWEEAAAHVPVLQAMRRILSDADFASYGEAYQRIVRDCARDTDDGITLEIGYTRVLGQAAG